MFRRLLHRGHHQFDFLTGHRRSQPRLRRRLVTGALITAGILALLAAFILPPTLDVWHLATEARAELAAGQRHLGNQRFEDARASFAQAEETFAQAQQRYRPIAWWRWLPIAGSNIRAGQELLTIAQVGVRAAQRVTDFADQLLTPLAKRGDDLTYGALSVAERDQLLARLGDSGSTLTALETDVQEILTRLDGLPRSYVTGRVKRELAPFREGLVLATEALERAAPIARVLPKLLGHGSAKTYLFLLQNNAELRPSGGFIGTYGILKVHNGTITSFATDNSYNLDDRVKGTLRIPAPAPLQRYNDVRNWFFRDSNWSPDFHVAAETAADFYRREGGREQLDGVLGVTPTLVEGLLRLTGPITVDSITFTADNLVDTLQEEVTFGFAQRGVGLAARKGIIGRMGQQLVDRLFAVPQRRWGELWQTLLTSLNEKHLQLSFNDDTLQAFADEQGWSGRVATPAHDSLLLVDANLASLKTDSVMTRGLRYEVDFSTATPTATATVTYTNGGTFTKKTTRYRTFLRLYVPQGATLVSSEGADLADRSSKPGEVDVHEDLDHTVFGAFKSIEPGQTETIVFRYSLPESVRAAVADGSYELTVQKQAGTIAPALTLVALFDRPARVTAGVDSLPTGRHTRHELTTDLRSDRYFRFRVGS